MDKMNENKILLENKKAFVLDLDGTVYIGNQPIQSSIDFINKYENDFKFYYMTNNTSNSKVNCLKKLISMGVNKVIIEDIISPVDALVSYLKENSLKNIYCLGTNAFKEELRNNQIEIKNFQDKIDALVMAYDTELNYQKIVEFSLLLKKDLPYLATHNDIVCPHENGFVPDVGSFIKMFEASNSRVPSKYFGKPNVDLLHSVLNKYDREELIIVGDRLYTDKVLADNANVDFTLVLTGETKENDITNNQNAPKLVLENLAEIVSFF